MWYSTSANVLKQGSNPALSWYLIATLTWVVGQSLHHWRAATRGCTCCAFVPVAPSAASVHADQVLPSAVPVSTFGALCHPTIEEAAPRKWLPIKRCEEFLFYPVRESEAQNLRICRPVTWLKKRKGKYTLLVVCLCRPSITPILISMFCPSPTETRWLVNLLHEPGSFNQPY